jgi:hypothetical protein
MPVPTQFEQILPEQFTEFATVLVKDAKTVSSQSSSACFRVGMMHPYGESLPLKDHVRLHRLYLPLYKVLP